MQKSDEAYKTGKADGEGVKGKKVKQKRGKRVKQKRDKSFGR